MASSFTKPYASCPETTNFARICRIVVDVLRDVLWQVLIHEIPPSDLPNKVKTTQTKLKLDVKIKTWLCGISPSSPEIPTAEKFDVSSLYALIRNLCTNVPVPSTRWGKPPPPGGTTLGDDIERVREFRNTLYGHATQAKIDTADFNKICTDINDLVSRFDMYFSVNCQAMKCTFKSDIDTVLTCSMDKTLEDEYIDKFKEIGDLFDNVKDQVDDAMLEIRFAKEDVINVKQQVTNVNQNVSVVKQDVGNVTQEVGSVKQDVGHVKQEVDNVNRKVGDVEENVGNLKDDLINVMQEVPKINQEVVGVKQEVGSVMQKVCEVIKNVCDVRQEVDYVRQEVGNVKQEVTRVKQEVANVNQSTDDVKQEVGNVEQEVGNVKQEVGKVKQELGNVFGKLGDVSQQVGDVENNVCFVKQAIGNVMKQVGDVKQHLEILQNEAGVKQQVGDVNSNLEILHEKVDVLKKDIAEIRDMLKRMPASVQNGGMFGQDLQTKEFGLVSDDSNEHISLGKIPSQSSQEHHSEDTLLYESIEFFSSGHIAEIKETLNKMSDVVVKGSILKKKTCRAKNLGW